MSNKPLPEATDQQLSQEEEAHFYFTLQSFQELVDNYGAAKVLDNLDYRTADKLMGRMLSMKFNTLFRGRYVAKS